MRKALFILALFVGAVAAQAQPVILIDNTDCVALDDPHSGCCTGLGTGTCDGKVSAPKIIPRSTMIEVCRGFWSRTCADTGIDTDGDGQGDQWFVEAETCTQGEADVSAALPTTTCNAAKITDGECRAEFTGSTIMPTVQGCRKAYKIWRNNQQIKPGRDLGRRTWRELDSTPADDSDIVGDGG